MEDLKLLVVAMITNEIRDIVKEHPDGVEAGVIYAGICEYGNCSVEKFDLFIKGLEQSGQIWRKGNILYPQVATSN